MEAQTQLSMWGSLESEISAFIRAPTVPVDRALGGVKARFECFHSSNPHVYSALVALARRLCSMGHTRISARGIYETLRTARALQTSGDDFKLNNNFTALYARLIDEQEPDLRGLFEFREQQGKPTWKI